MSRLDDELKSMFQQQHPSADFAERLLARIDAQAQPKPSLWQRLVSLFQLPRMRWAVAATAILLIALIGVVQYQRLHKNTAAQQRASVRENQGIEDPTTATADKDSDGINKPEKEKIAGSDKQTGIVAVKDSGAKPHHQRKLNHRKASATLESAIARQRKSAGEFAKEQLMQALFIASATVNEAKKMAMGDD